MRSVWKPLKAVSTRWTWNASAFASSEHGEDEGEEEGDALADGLGDGDGLALDVAVGLADGDADALGLGDASVIVIVVTPFCVETLTRAPVAPSRNRPEIAPDFAWSNSDNSFPSISPPLLATWCERLTARDRYARGLRAPVVLVPVTSGDRCVTATTPTCSSCWSRRSRSSAAS